MKLPSLIGPSPIPWSSVALTGPLFPWKIWWPKSQNLFVEAATVEEVKTFLGILERGVDGLVITAPDLGELKRLLNMVKEISPPVELVAATLARVKSLGMGDRVCVDTCTQMEPGQGMLVGNSSAALFLVHAESLENPYVAARPFRVNAGPGTRLYSGAGQ